MKIGDFVYYRNKFGSHEPAIILKIGKKKALIKSDGSGDTEPRKTWVNISNIELQWVI